MNNRKPSKKVIQAFDHRSSVVISDFLPTNDLISMSQINKDFYRYTKSYGKSGFYYAVGSRIDLFEYSPFGMTGGRRQEFPEQEIVDSLDKRNQGVLLFHDYSTAKNYVYLTEHSFYDSQSDFFKVDFRSAIFVVCLLRDNQYNQRPITMRIKDNIPDCPSPPPATEMEFTGLKTSKNNVKIFFSSFNGRLFKGNAITEGRFAHIWSQAVSHHCDAQQSAIAGISALFNSYFTWYSTFTRHHQVRIKHILDAMAQNPSLEELNTLLGSDYQRAMADNTINKNGHYVQMLEFAINQIKILGKLDQLPGINDYIKEKKQSIFH